MTQEAKKIAQRIYAVDLLRGVVMMIMLLDHTRDFVHQAAMISDPTDPVTTTVPIFFTRWITHFCAPAFVFLSGISIYLQKMNGKTNRDLTWFLFTRGLWLIVLEFTVIRFLIFFNLDYASNFGMAQVIMVPSTAMAEALARHPVLAGQHQALSSMRFRILLRHVEVQGANSSRRGVCLHLLDLVHSYGAAHELGTVISITFTQQEMGSICGLSRVSVSRIFSQLEREQVIARSGRLVVILDQTRLEVLAHT